VCQVGTFTPSEELQCFFRAWRGIDDDVGEILPFVRPDMMHRAGGDKDGSVRLYVVSDAVDRYAALGDKNSLSLGRSIGDCILVCQGQTWHIMLGTRVLRWTGVFRPGIVHRESDGNRGVKFDERWPFA